MVAVRTEIRLFAHLEPSKWAKSLISRCDRPDPGDQTDNAIVQWSRIVHLEAENCGLGDGFCPLNEPDTRRGCHGGHPTGRGGGQYHQCGGRLALTAPRDWSPCCREPPRGSWLRERWLAWVVLQSSHRFALTVTLGWWVGFSAGFDTFFEIRVLASCLGGWPACSSSWRHRFTL